MTESRSFKRPAIALVSALLHSGSVDAAPGALRRRRTYNELQQQQHKSQPQDETTHDLLHINKKPSAVKGTRYVLQDAEVNGIMDNNHNSRHRGGGRQEKEKREVQKTTSSPEVQPQQYIVGGNQAPTHRYGYYTSVYESFGSANYHICGGSLIHDDIVLTAAHCAADADSVRIGAYMHSMNTNGGAPMHQTDVVGRIEHPNFFADKYNRLHNDIAILKLKEPVTDPELLQSIVSLDLSGDYSKNLVPGEALTAIGLGQLREEGDVSTFLQEVEVGYVPRQKCYEIFKGGINEDAMCAWTKGQDACGGDSGGSLIIKGNDAQTDVQVGIISWGAGCASPYPGVYSNIHHVATWLTDEVCKITDVPSERFGCGLGDIDIATPLGSPDESPSRVGEAEQSEPESDPGQVNISSEENDEDASSANNICEDRGNCAWIPDKRWPEFWCVFQRSNCSRTCGRCSDEKEDYDEGRSTTKKHN